MLFRLLPCSQSSEISGTFHDSATNEKNLFPLTFANLPHEKSRKKIAKTQTNFAPHEIWNISPAVFVCGLLPNSKYLYEVSYTGLGHPTRESL